MHGWRERQKGLAPYFCYVLGANIHSPEGGPGGGGGVFVTDKLFIGAAARENVITCLCRTVLEINYLFYAKSARNYLFQKIL